MKLNSVNPTLKKVQSKLEKHEGLEVNKSIRQVTVWNVPLANWTNWTSNWNSAYFFPIFLPFFFTIFWSYEIKSRNKIHIEIKSMVLLTIKRSHYKTTHKAQEMKILVSFCRAGHWTNWPAVREILPVWGWCKGMRWRGFALFLVRFFFVFF